MKAAEIRQLPDEVLERLVTCPTTKTTTRPLGQHLIERANPTGSVIVVVDLDGLKQINDTEGHDAGDRLLALAGKVLASIMRPDDLLIRAGGDEFWCLVSTADPGSDWPGIQHRFRLALDGRHGVVASVGAAPGNDPKTADARMYEQKRTRRGA